MSSRSAPTATTRAPYAGSAQASIRACRLVPAPETRTTRRVVTRRSLGLLDAALCWHQAMTRAPSKAADAERRDGGDEHVGHERTDVTHPAGAGRTTRHGGEYGEGDSGRDPAAATAQRGLQPRHAGCRRCHHIVASGGDRRRQPDQRREQRAGARPGRAAPPGARTAGAARARRRRARRGCCRRPRSRGRAGTIRRTASRWAGSHRWRSRRPCPRRPRGAAGSSSWRLRRHRRPATPGTRRSTARGTP